MRDLRNSTTAQYAGTLAIAAATSAAFWIGDGAQSGIVTGIFMLAFVTALHVGRRHSDAVATAGGIGDERTRTLNTRAAAATAHVMSLVLPAWWLVTVAQGDSDETLNLLCAIFGATYIVASIWYSRRA